MASLVLTVDPDSDRRRQFLRSAAARAAPLPGLVIDHAEVGDLAAVWACRPDGPRSCHVAGDEFALLMGYAVDEFGRWLDAKGLLAQATGTPPRQLVFDGYFLAATYSRRRGLALGVDPLGIFPLYYAACGGLLLAGTSPELLAAHPSFESSLDLRGLTGILLTNGLVANQGLLAGVRRLGVGCGLRWTPAQGTHEVEGWQLRAHDDHRRLSADEAREQVDAELRRAIHRHRPPQASTVLMLSGGLDSRLMAGCLVREGIEDFALCLGQPTDFEVRAATQVAAALPMRLHVESREADAEEHLQLARLAARWEHLSAGFGSLEAWADGAALGRLAPFFWSGFVGDEVLGGFAPRFGRDPQNGAWSFERFLRQLNRWGLAPERLAALLHTPESRRLVDEQIDAFRCDYYRREETPWQRSFRAKLATRVRYHIGAILQRLSFHSWPLLPILDRRLLELLFNVDVELLLERRLERDLLESYYPRLAEIPLDTNSFCFERSRAKGARDVPFLSRTATSLRRRARQWYWRLWRGVEPRRYYRFYDFNGARWRAVRRAAEAHRGWLEEWFDRKALDALLPPPEVKLRYRNPFQEAASQRSLLGLLLWQATRGAGLREAA